MIFITDILDNIEIDFLLFDQIQNGWSNKTFEDNEITQEQFIQDVNDKLEELMDWREEGSVFLNILDVLYKVKHGQHIECELGIFLEFGTLQEITERKEETRKRKLKDICTN